MKLGSHIRTLAFTVLIGGLLVSLAGCDAFFKGDDGGDDGNGETANDTLFIPSTISLDRATRDITFPLYEGEHDGATVWYIVTEASDQEKAGRLGSTFRPSWQMRWARPSCSRWKCKMASATLKGPLTLARSASSCLVRKASRPMNFKPVRWEMLTIVH